MQRDQVRELKEEIATMQQLVAARAEIQESPFVRNDDLRSRSVHRVAIGGYNARPVDWQTKCRWPYGTRKHTLLKDLDGVSPFDLCATCLPVERAEAERQFMQAIGE